MESSPRQTHVLVAVSFEKIDACRYTKHASEVPQGVIKSGTHPSHGLPNNSIRLLLFQFFSPVIVAHAETDSHHYSNL